MTDAYLECFDYMKALYQEIGGCEFYAELFPGNEKSGELNEDFSHPNAIYLYRDDRAGRQGRACGKLRRRIMLDDVWDQDYADYVEDNTMTLCSGLTYRGRANRLQNAMRMNALVFDLDGVGLNELRNLFLRFDGDPQRIRRLPMPTFLVLSGAGVHLYYVFQQPLDLFPNIKLQLKNLKYDLTFRMWDYKGTSRVEEIQYHSINQSFRMVGSINDKYGNRIVAFRVGDRVTIDYLNAYAKPENRVDVGRPFKPSKMTRDEAKVSYPEWYERVVVNGIKRPKHWDIAGKTHGDDPYALYHWWLNRVGEVKGGHRYFFMMCLAVYACKCDVPKKKLRQDMKKAFEDLCLVSHENELTEADIRSAMEAYDKAYYNFTIRDIEMLSGLRIDRNKRNGLKQSQHLFLARRRKDDMKGVGIPMKSKEGRPKGRNLRDDVCNWRQQNPVGTKNQCRADTGLSYPTIRRWWGTVPVGVEESVKVESSPNLN